MSELETAVRQALARRLRKARVPDMPAWDDEAVREILAAAGGPSGVVTASTPEAADALARLKERAEGTEALAAEMLAAFSKGTSGWSARVSAARVEKWRAVLASGPGGT